MLKIKLRLKVFCSNWKKINQNCHNDSYDWISNFLSNKRWKWYLLTGHYFLTSFTDKSQKENNVWKFLISQFAELTKIIIYDDINMANQQKRHLMSRPSRPSVKKVLWFKREANLFNVEKKTISKKMFFFKFNFLIRRYWALKFTK